MTQYIQYDADGNITSTVFSYGIAAPDCVNQIITDDDVDTLGKKVNLENGTLIDIEV